MPAPDGTVVVGPEPPADRRGTGTGEGTGSGPAAGSVRDLSKIDLNVRVEMSPEGQGLLPPPPPPPPGVIEQLSLRPTADGGYRYEDKVMWARIHADGQVTIQDRVVNVVVSPGTVKPGDGVRPVIIRPPMVGMEVDMTDVIMRAVGDDPYLSRKLRFLEQTADLRAELAATAYRATVVNTIMSLTAELRALWDDEKVPIELRRRELFQLWDDCEDDPNESAAKYGAQARATILAFIRRRLPASSPKAYSPPELRLLNQRRRSVVPFDPYGTLGE